MSMPDRPGSPSPLPFTQEDWDEVSDNPEWTAEDFKRARPFAEVFPEMAEALRRSRGPQKAPTKELVSIRLDRDVVEHFRASGAGWQTRVNDLLRAAMKR